MDAFKEVALLFFWTLQFQENSEPVMTRRQQSVSDSVFPTHCEFDTLVTCMVLLPFILAVYQNAVEVSTDYLTTSFLSYKRLTAVYVDCPSQ